MLSWNFYHTPELLDQPPFRPANYLRASRSWANLTILRLLWSSGASNERTRLWRSGGKSL